MADETKKITWTKIWQFIKSRVFTILIIILLIMFSAWQCSRINDLKRQQEQNQQNIIALNDSVHIERTKNGELIAYTSGLISSIKDLKDLNRGLYDKVKASEGKIIALNNAIIQLVQDSTTLAEYLSEKDKVISELLKIDDSTYVAAWTLPFIYDSTNFDILSGKTYIGIKQKDPLELAHINTELVKRISQIDLTFGERVVKNQYQVYVMSAFPGFTVKSLNGFMTDPNDNKYIKSLMKKRHWFQGFSVGVGATPGFDITTGKYGMSMGPTIMWNIYTW